MKTVGLLVLVMSSSLWAQENRSLEAAIQELGDRPYYVTEKNCESNCRKIPYEYETEWFWLSDSEKVRRRTKNIERRNEWLKQSKLFPTQSEVEAGRIARERADLEKALVERARAQERLTGTISENDKKLKQLEEQKKAIQLKKEALMAEARKLFEASEAATAGDTSFTEDITGLFGGNNPRRTAEEKKKIEQLERTRKELRRIQGEMDKLERDALKLETETIGARTQLTGLTAEITKGSDELRAKSDQYGKAVDRIKSERGRQVATVDEQTMAFKKENAEKFAKEKLQELQNKKDLANFILQDIDTIKKDLQIGDLEAKLLTQKINGVIEKSLLGKYIQEQMQKTLNAAMDGSCQMAKLCSQHDSINNDTRRKMEPVLDAITKEYLDTSATK
ncbi:MAG: hypothetical protein Fur0010_08940 [Bdellovibrio sp.]